MKRRSSFALNRKVKRTAVLEHDVVKELGRRCGSAAGTSERKRKHKEKARGQTPSSHKLHTLLREDLLTELCV